MTLQIYRLWLYNVTLNPTWECVMVEFEKVLYKLPKKYSRIMIFYFFINAVGSTNGMSSSGGTPGNILTPSMASAMSNLSISKTPSSSSSNVSLPSQIPLHFNKNFSYKEGFPLSRCENHYSASIYLINICMFKISLIIFECEIKIYTDTGVFTICLFSVLCMMNYIECRFELKRLFMNDSLFIFGFMYFQFVQPMNIPLKSYELLNRMTGKGLGITYKFTRTVSVFSPKMVSIELTLTNHGDNQLSAIKIGKKVRTFIVLLSTNKCVK